MSHVVTYRTVWGRPQNVTLGRPEDVDRGPTQNVNRGHPLALYKEPYGDVHRKSFGDIFRTSLRSNFTEWAVFRILKCLGNNKKKIRNYLSAVNEVVIFAAGNILFKLTLVYTADSHTRFSFRLLLGIHELILFFHLNCHFYNLIFWLCFSFCIITYHFVCQFPFHYYYCILL